MDGYIFDLDGTIIDSMGVWMDIDRIVLKKYGKEFPTDYDSYVATVVPLSPKETSAYAVKYFGIEATAEELEEQWGILATAAYSNDVAIKPHAKEFLQTLKAKGCKIAIATSSPKKLCMAALHNHGIADLFDAFSYSEEVGCGKSKPDVFLSAAKKLGNLKPSDCVVFEDNITAMRTAKGAGMSVCGVYDENAAREWENIKSIADWTITAWNEAEILKGLFK